jgi:hypothetical protein
MDSSNPTSRKSSRSRSKSQARPKRSAQHANVPYLPQGPESIVYAEGSVTEDTVELLHEFVHPHPKGRRAETEDTLIEEDRAGTTFDDNGRGNEDGGNESDDDLEDWDALKERPWYRRPSPLWYVPPIHYTTPATAVTAV